MTSRICVSSLIGVVVTITLACGCASSTDSVASDPALARDLVNAVYAGSLTTLQKSLDPRFQRGVPDWVTAGTSALLKDRFGPVQGVRLQSVGKPHRLAIEAFWTVDAKQADFEMRVCFHEGKIPGIWWRPSPAHQWSPEPQTGADYAKRQKLPPGW